MKAPSGIYSSPDARGKYKATGEFREPRRGEFYLSGAIVEAYRAPNDLSTKYWIAVKAAAAAPMHRADLHAPSDAPPVVPMADERETAQWYTVNYGEEGIREVLKPFPVFRYGSLVSWNQLPAEAKIALRRKLYDNRRTCYNHGKNYNPACPTCKEITETLFYDLPSQPTEPAQLSPAPGTFVDLLRPEAVGFVDITPEVLKTPEGCARVNQAVKEFEDATANVANAAEEYVKHYYQGDCITALNDLRDAIATRRAKQEAFLRAMANQPPQSDRAKTDPNNTTKTGPDGLFPALS